MTDVIQIILFVCLWLFYKKKKRKTQQTTKNNNSVSISIKNINKLFVFATLVFKKQQLYYVNHLLFKKKIIYF